MNLETYVKKLNMNSVTLQTYNNRVTKPVME